MTDCIFHPENLKSGKWYKFTFRSALSDEGDRKFTITARFKNLVVDDSELQSEDGIKRLKILVRVGGETCFRRISWSRIVHIIPHEVE